MALVLTSPPALEPVSIAEAKDHLKVGHSDEDALISSLILTSRLHIEAALSLALIEQSWTWTLDRWPEGRANLTLPLRPVSAINSISVLDSDGVPTVVSQDDYALDGDAVPPRLVRVVNQWPKPGQSQSGIEIAFTAGFGSAADDVPQPVRHAHLLLVAHWYEHRDPIEIGSDQTTIPNAVSILLKPYRVARL